MGWQEQHSTDERSPSTTKHSREINFRQTKIFLRQRSSPNGEKTLVWYQESSIVLEQLNKNIKVWPSSQTVLMKTLRILVNTFSPDKMWRKLVLIPAKSYACMYVMFSLRSKQQSIFPCLQKLIKVVRAKIFQLIDFLKFFLQSYNELLVSQMKKNGGHWLRFRIKACGKLAWFWKFGALNSAWS